MLRSGGPPCISGGQAVGMIDSSRSIICSRPFTGHSSTIFCVNTSCSSESENRNR